MPDNNQTPTYARVWALISNKQKLWDTHKKKRKQKRKQKLWDTLHSSSSNTVLFGYITNNNNQQNSITRR